MVMKKGTIMQYNEFVKTYKVDPNSIVRSVQVVGSKIIESGDPLVTANKIIMNLGGSTQTSPIDARVMAQALTEQILVQKDGYDVEKAISIANAKLEKIRREMSFMYAIEEKEVEATVSADGKVRASRKGSAEKKAKALEIFQANRDKKESDVAKLIQVQLGITFANAYYYVNRVFKGK